MPETLKQLEQVHEAIYNTSYGIKTVSNPVRKEAKIILQESAEAMIHKGASAMIMGCTEDPISLTTRLNSCSIDRCDRDISKSTYQK